jgi:menaquinone-dependent protoporphyrinogen oxidase
MRPPLGDWALGIFKSVRDDAIAIYYATRDGQARRIAEHIWRRLNGAGMLAAPRNLLPALPVSAELAQAALIVLVAAVRYGKHLPETDRFLSVYSALPAPPPLALASVNLSARKPGKTTGSGNTYLRKTIARHRLMPAVAVAFAGRLDYRRYSWRDRQIIRFIMLLTGGPTDPETSIEYTSWNAVDEFADEIAALRQRD